MNSKIFKTIVIGLGLLILCNDQVVAQHKTTDTIYQVISKESLSICEGNSNDAVMLSGTEYRLVIYIRGGKGVKGKGYKEKYTAQQYGEILVALFKDTTYTQNPLDIAVVFSESGDEQPTWAKVYMDGFTYKLKGNGVFHPMRIGMNIEHFTDAYIEQKKMER